MGKLFVIEGVDGSGKSTQAKLVAEALERMGKKVKLINYPTYTRSSALIEMYLAGEFGENANDVNAYAASTFYAVDRCADYLANWKKDYDDGAIVISSRYTTSNEVHQAVKLPAQERDGYIEWLEDFEYNKVGIPKPDKVFFLDMAPKYTQKLISHRYEANGGKRDIHEKDEAYLQHCYDSASYVREKLGWVKIDCVEDERILSIEEITAKLLAEIERA